MRYVSTIERRKERHRHLYVPAISGVDSLLGTGPNVVLDEETSALAGVDAITHVLEVVVDDVA